MTTTAFNLVALRGALSSEPRLRTLPSGTVLASLEVTVPRHDGPDHTVPVAHFDPPATVERLAAGDEVVVVGCVRRRFFRAGGATVSRTEVVADLVLPARQRRRVAQALARAALVLTSEPPAAAAATADR